MSHSLDSIPVGSTLTRRYYAVATAATRGIIGDAAEDWNAAVIHARDAHAAIIAQLTEAGDADDDYARAVADRSVYIELRWDVALPDGRGSIDLPVERYDNVAQLRLHTAA